MTNDGVAVLFSAGLDSAVLLAHAAREHPSVQPIYVSAGLAWEAEERAMSERLLDRAVSGGSDATASPLEALSDRELEVFQALGNGSSTAQIATQLGLSVKTIETYREHLKRKLGLRSGQELLRYAIEWAVQDKGRQGSDERPVAG